MSVIGYIKRCSQCDVQMLVTVDYKHGDCALSASTRSANQPPNRGLLKGSNVKMSNHNDIYLRALKDASAALDVLADTAFAAAVALDFDHTGDDYDFAAHRTAVDRHNGICAGVLEIYGLIEQHRAGAA